MKITKKFKMAEDGDVLGRGTDLQLRVTTKMKDNSEGVLRQTIRLTDSEMFNMVVIERWQN